jgi:flavin reductase (DIM6/NTAB) family NADH-FMN oxidoreductase RutF
MNTPDRADTMKIIQGREIAALLNPRAAALVTCCDDRGEPNVLAIAWHTPLSHDPPLLGIAVDHRRYSHRLICATGEFVLNIVPVSFQAAVEYCGTHSGCDGNKFQAAGLSILPAACVRPPRIAGALACLECTRIEQVQTGDHTLFIGRVVCAEARVDGFDDAWQKAGGDVLLCLQRERYVTWTERFGLEA